VRTGGRWLISMLSDSKKFKRIGEVSKLTGLAPSVLRFWEKEFEQLSPIKRKGQRLYSNKDLEFILLIKDLLYERGFTIEGARRYLEGAVMDSNPKRARLIREIKGELEALLEVLDE